MGISKVKQIGLSIGLIFFLLMLHYSMKDLVWNYTDSINVKLSRLSKEKPKKGDYATFKFSHPLIKNGKQVRLSKRFACGPGDILVTKQRDIFCNDVFMGTALERTGHDKPLSVFQWNGVIPPGKAYMSGDIPTSFDSRYWGFIDQSELTKINPIL